MKKIALIYGLIAGLVVVAMMFITMPFVMDGTLEHSHLLGYATMVIALSTIFIAIKNYRDKQSNGTIKFGKAFLIGLYITLIGGVLYASGWEIYMAVSGMNMQEFSEGYMQGEVAKLEKAGASAAEIEAVKEEGKHYMEMMKNPLVRFLFVMFLELVPVGIIISLISAAVLRKKNVLPANV